MGFHTCEYCLTEQRQYPATSSGDVELIFADGHSYWVPDMISHYVEEHLFLPSSVFMQDVLNGRIVSKTFMQETGSWHPTSVRIGYLQGSYEHGKTTDTFQLRLRQCIERATLIGHRAQTRGV